MSNSFEELFYKIQNLGGNIQEGLYKGVGQYLSKIQADAKRLCTVNTGYLRNSIHTKVKYDGEDIVGTVGTNLDYGIYVEMGTGPVGEESTKILPPDVIPKYKQEGWYYKADDGNVYYTKGQVAKPFLYPAFKSNENNAKEYIKKGLNAHIRSLND